MNEIQSIQDATAAAFGVTIGELLSARRPQHIADARLASMALSREITRCTLTVIGRAHNRDHATVVHAMRRVVDLVEVDAGFRRKFDAARKAVAL